MPAARFHVVLVVPDAQHSAQGAREVAETLLHGLRRSGREATLAVNGVDRGAVNIVLNPHLLGVEAAQTLPPETILYNFEPVQRESEHLKLRYVDLVRRHVTWDASRNNVEAWQRYVPGVRVAYMPLGSAPEMAPILDAALRTEPPAPAADPAPIPRRLNAGSGKGWRIDCVNVDVDPLWRPDLVADLGKPLAAGKVVDLGRFGRRELPLDYFDEIHASHLLEHIPDLVTAMGTFLALLRAGGRLHAEVPYDLSYGAWQDPTHVRAMNERSWLYYTDWFWYLGWQEHRFELVELQYLLSDIGRKLSAAGTPFEEFVRIPRAVDAMRVVLRKVRLTDEERARGADRWA